ncbi:MAG: preprotein translocase subunit YajC [Streptosporangiaceae bacterium]|nr:preprotein translocase subunit YajC [Streptosporangiaceae bacterium]
MGTIAAAEAATKSSGSSSFTFLLLILLVFVGFYFLMIRPQRRRQQQAARQQNTVTPGARVRTTAGMYATVAAVDGDDLVLEVAPGVEVRYMKRAIMEVMSPGEPEAAAADEPAEGAEEAEETQETQAAGHPAEDAPVSATAEDSTTSHDRPLTEPDKHNVP